MPKPQWLIDRENGKVTLGRKLDLCMDCAYFGRPVSRTRHRDKEMVMVHECEIHEGCLNTRFSVGCEDWTPLQLV